MSFYTSFPDPSMSSNSTGRNYCNRSTSQALSPLPSMTSLPPLAGGSREVSCESACSVSSAVSLAGQPKLFVEHNYQDHSQDPLYTDTSENAVSGDGKRRGPRGGVLVPFPEKLYLMLAGVHAEGLEDVVSWQPHGRCFAVHQPQRFVEEVMPRYFSQTKLTSFQRQVNLYGFRRLTSGPDRTGYYHEYFLRGRPDLLKKIARIRVKGIGCKLAPSPETEPNFYQYSTCRDTEAHSDPLSNLLVLDSLMNAPCAKSEFRKKSCEKDSSLSEKLKMAMDCSHSAGFAYLADKTLSHHLTPEALRTDSKWVERLQNEATTTDAAFEDVDLQPIPLARESSLAFSSTASLAEYLKNGQNVLASFNPTPIPEIKESVLGRYMSYTPLATTGNSILDFQDDIISILGSQ